MSVGAIAATIAILSKIYATRYGSHIMMARLIKLATITILYVQAAATWQSTHIDQCGVKKFDKGTIVFCAGLLSAAYLFLHPGYIPRDPPNLLGIAVTQQRSRW